MAEYCLNCWNSINNTNDSEQKYIFSDEPDLCEGCGEWKKVIVMDRKYYYQYKFRFIIFPFKMIYKIIYLLWRIVILPYLIYKYKKAKNLTENK